VAVDRHKIIGGAGAGRPRSDLRVSRTKRRAALSQEICLLCPVTYQMASSLCFTFIYSPPFRNYMALTVLVCQMTVRRGIGLTSRGMPWRQMIMGKRVGKIK